MSCWFFAALPISFHSKKRLINARSGASSAVSQRPSRRDKLAWLEKSNFTRRSRFDVFGRLGAVLSRKNMNGNRLRDVIDVVYWPPTCSTTSFTCTPNLLNLFSPHLHNICRVPAPSADTNAKCNYLGNNKNANAPLSPMHYMQIMCAMPSARANWLNNEKEVETSIKM